MEGYLKRHKHSQAGEVAADVATSAGRGGAANNPTGCNRESPTEGRRGDLTRRFFVLHGPFFTQFKSHVSLIPVKDVSIDIRGRGIVILDTPRCNDLFPFEILNNRNDPLYTLFASSELERRRWVFSLISVARLPCSPT
uniref:Oxysterol-binding protein 1 n=1 Tax=Lygus hesperus TaxID=30085 RepID=A0A0A9XBZ4_LYGHE